MTHTSPAEQLQAFLSKGRRGARKQKFNAEPTDGYHSKREARYAKTLQARKNAGDIVGWLEQVPVKLPGKIRCVLDFMIQHVDGTVSFVEVKGFETRVWKNNLKQIEELHPWIFKRLEIV